MKKYTKFEIQKNNLKFIEIQDIVKKNFSFRCYIQLKNGEINENKNFIFHNIKRSSLQYNDNEEEKYENEFDFVKNHIKILGYKKFNIEEITNEILFNFIDDENMGKFNYELIKNKNNNINDLLND